MPELSGNSYRELRDYASKFLNDGTPVLILAPVRIAADEIARSMTSHAASGVYRHTLDDLIIALSTRAMNERGLTPIGHVTAEATASKVVAETRGSLRYLAPVSATPGFPRAVARTVNELRLNGVTPEQVHDTGRSGPCLAHLLRAWESELTKQGFADRATRARIALEVLESKKHELCGMRLLCLDVRPKNVFESQVLDTLRSQAAECFELRFDDTSETIELPQETDLFSASGEALEAAEITRRVLALAAEGIPFDEMAVLLRNGTRYQPLVQEAFERAGIPGWFSHGTRRPEISGRAFLVLLHCRAEGLSAARFAEYLSLGVVPGEEGEQRFTRRWERLLLKAGVIGGRDRWNARLQALIDNSEQLLGSSEEKERASAVRDIHDLETMRGFCLPIVDMLDRLPEGGTWAKWIEALWDLAARALNQPQGVHQLLETLSPMSEIGPITTGDVIVTLETELTSIRRKSESNRYGKVFVGNIEEAAGLVFKAVFLPGMNEGVFPAPVREDPLLLDAQRSRLGIAQGEDDNLLLRTAVACASERLIASWSRIDLATGRERVPSFYAFEIAEAAKGGSEIDPETFDRDARAQTETRLGWPSPLSTEAAIDDAEYDLAYLRRNWHQETAGSAAWLKLANPHVHRALLARWYRWESKWKWADGLVDSATGILESEFSPRVHAFKTTDMEEFARCPYRFLLKAIYRLQAADSFTPLQRMDPLIRGTLFHAVQERVLTELRDRGLLPLTEQRLTWGFRILDDILKHEADQLKAQHAPAIEAVWNIDVQKLREDLKGWLRYAALNDGNWVPSHFEMEFADARIFDNWLLKGRIDLVETSEHRVRITDHKTGKVPREEDRPKAIGGGEVLQPVLYALSAAQKLGTPVTDSRLFYATIRNNYTEIPIPITETTTSAAHRMLTIIESGIHKEFLPAAPREDGCRNCEYVPICGPYEEERTTRKQPDRIRPLMNIRAHE